MIPIDFVYYQPENIEEATKAFSEAKGRNLNPLYYAGGTEVLTLGRNAKIQFGAVIDIKGIEECRSQYIKGDEIVFGSAATLSEIVEENLFPLLSQTTRRIADRTVRNRITLGGNVAGRLSYRESILPLLVSEAKLRVVGPTGERIVKVEDVFSKRLLLEEGEFIVQIKVENDVAKSPWYHERRERQSRVDYPLITACFLRQENDLSMAVSGLYTFPVRNMDSEKILCRKTIPLEERRELVMAAFSGKPRDDKRASGEYRTELFKQVLENALERLC
jgi:CO/xanthine dehydrogenase FAD-binding subunit